MEELLRILQSEIDPVDILRGNIVVSMDDEPDFVDVRQINASPSEKAPSNIVLGVTLGSVWTITVEQEAGQGTLMIFLMNFKYPVGLTGCYFP